MYNENDSRLEFPIAIIKGIGKFFKWLFGKIFKSKM